MRSLAVVAVVVLLGSACTSQKKKNKAALAAAQVEQTAALASLRAGEPTDAVHHFQDSVTVLERLRRTTAPPMSEDPGDGPVVDGLTARAWQERWEQEFKDEIETQLPTLLAATASGKLDWNTGRSIFTAYRRDLDDRWVAGLKNAAAGEVASRTDAYHLRCESGSEELCQRVKAVLLKKFTSKLDDKVLLSLDEEKNMLGAVVMSGSFGRYRKYAEVKDLNKNEAFTLPSTLDITVEVQTFQGTSSWDGVLQLSAALEPPVAISSDTLRAQETEQFDALYAKALAPLEAKTAQTRP